MHCTSSKNRGQMDRKIKISVVTKCDSTHFCISSANTGSFQSVAILGVIQPFVNMEREIQPQIRIYVNQSPPTHSNNLKTSKSALNIT